MNVIHMILRTAVVAAAAATSFGCGETQPAAFPTETETTAAASPMDTSPTSAEVARLQRERNDANMALAEERTARASTAAVEKAHDELEARVLDAMEKADGQIQALRAKAAKASAKERNAIDKAVTEAQQHKTQLYGDLRRLRGELSESWDDFHTRVESTIADLNRVIAMESAQPEKAGQPEKAAQPAKAKEKKEEEKKKE